jgi:hypothetical protein
MSQPPASVLAFVEGAIAHRESRRVPLWGILHNRPVYEHVLGPQRVGNSAEIRDEVKRLLEIGAPGGGFSIGDSSSVLPDTPVKNLLAFYETVHEYSR